MGRAYCPVCRKPRFVVEEGADTVYAHRREIEYAWVRFSCGHHDSNEVTSSSYGGWDA